MPRSQSPQRVTRERHCASPSSSRGRRRRLAAASLTLLAATLAACSPSARPTQAPTTAAGSPSSTPSHQAYDELRIDTASLPAPGIASPTSVSGGGSLTDRQQYTYTATWNGSYQVGSTDISKAPPGSADLPITPRGSITLTNTTPGRQAPAGVLRGAALHAVFASGRPACAGLPEDVLGRTTYCALDVADGAFDTQIDAGSSAKAASAPPTALRVAEGQVLATKADLAKGPDLWVLTAGYGSRVVVPEPACSENWNPLGMANTVVWASTPPAGCVVPLTGATKPVVAGDGKAAGAVINDLLTNHQQEQLPRCPALPADGDGTIASLTTGVEGLDGSLSFGPLTVPQDLKGNDMACMTTQGAPGGIILRLGRSAPQDVDPQVSADDAMKAMSMTITASQPVQLLDGTMLVVAVGTSGATIAHWDDGQLSISASIGSDGTQAQKFQRIAVWMAANLPAILANVAAFQN